MKKITILSLLFLALPVFAHAHAEGEKIQLKDHYLEYAFIPEEAKLNVQQSVQITIEQSKTFEPVVGMPLWIRLSSPSGKVLFTSNNFVTNNIGPVTASFLPTEAGEYTVDVKLLDTDEQGSFTLSVPTAAAAAPSNETLNNQESHADIMPEKNVPIAKIFILGCAIAIVGLFIVLGRRRSQNHDDDVD